MFDESVCITEVDLGLSSRGTIKLNFRILAERGRIPIFSSSYQGEPTRRPR